jgi:hypothetical protein
LLVSGPPALRRSCGFRRRLRTIRSRANRVESTAHCPGPGVAGICIAVVTLEAGINDGSAELPTVGHSLVKGKFDVLKDPLCFRDVDQPGYLRRRVIGREVHRDILRRECPVSRYRCIKGNPPGGGGPIGIPSLVRGQVKEDVLDDVFSVPIDVTEADLQVGKDLMLDAT